MYTLDGIDLSTYGLTPSQAPGSNLAIAGHLDFPKRLGKAFHVWPDEPGIEPYVAESELRWEGRDIRFYGFIKESSKLAVLTKTEALISQLNEITDLVDFVTPWGTFAVLVKDSVEIEQNVTGVAKVMIPFRQPDTGVTFSPSGGVAQGIDGVDFEDFGFTYLRLDGQWSRPGTKDQKAIGYYTEPYQITKPNAREMTLKGLFISPDYATMAAKVAQLSEILAKPGVRTLQISGEPYREFFCCNGFTVSQIIVQNTVSAVIEVRMMEVNRPVFNPEFLTDEFGDLILSESQKIIIRN
jgi:hypothetical protein